MCSEMVNQSSISEIFPSNNAVNPLFSTNLLGKILAGVDRDLFSRDKNIINYLPNSINLTGNYSFIHLSCKLNFQTNFQ